MLEPAAHLRGPVIVAWWLQTIAGAQECATAFTEFELRALVSASEGAIFNDDPLTHKQLYSEFTSRVPCLDHQLAKDAWARLLLDEAIVRNVAKGNWQPLLEVALHVYPDLKVPKYVLDQYVRPPPQKYGETPIPDDATLFVDGVLQTRIPLLVGEHVVQVWRDQQWRSVFLDGTTTFPAEWLVPKPKEVIEVVKLDQGWIPSGRGAVGFGFGFLVANQFVEDPGTYLADSRLLGGNSALGSHGFQPIASNGGAFWDGMIRAITPSVRRLGGTPSFEPNPAVLPLGYFGPAVVFDQVGVGVGGGLFALQKVEGAVARSGLYPQLHVALDTRAGRASFGLGGGLSPSAAHGGMRGGWVITKVAPLALQLGFDSNLDVVWFTEAPPGDRGASVLQLGVVARIDLVWGADR